MQQLEDRGVVVKTGTLVDATVIASASTNKDMEARWVGHRRKAPVHSYKAHVASDRDGGIVRSTEITPANVNDGRMIGAVLPENPGETYADLAYASAANENLIRTAGGQSCLPGRGVWDGEKCSSWAGGLEPQGQPYPPEDRCFGIPAFARTGSGSEATACGGCGGSDWKAALQVRLTATAYNLRRAIALVRVQTA